MLLLDENIVDSQRLLLESWRLHPHQIGQNTGRAGMQDDQIIPLLRSLDKPTFCTRDLEFFSRDEPHPSFCIVCLSVGQHEVASFVRRVLRHADFNSKAKRMGRCLFVSSASIRVKTFKSNNEISVKW